MQDFETRNPWKDRKLRNITVSTVRMTLSDVRNQKKCIKIQRNFLLMVYELHLLAQRDPLLSEIFEGANRLWNLSINLQFMHTIPLILIPFGSGSNSWNCLYLWFGKSSHFYRHPIKCNIFSDNGECHFVDITAGISVIGWEPDREFDHMKSTWTALMNMKFQLPH